MSWILECNYNTVAVTVVTRVPDIEKSAFEVAAVAHVFPIVYHKLFWNIAVAAIDTSFWSDTKQCRSAQFLEHCKQVWTVQVSSNNTFLRYAPSGYPGSIG